jgi:hypothetical protein
MTALPRPKARITKIRRVVAKPQPPLEPVPDPGPSHRVLWLTLGTLAFGIHLVGLTQYGWFRDELYYVVCARNLGWGYVDHPPLSIAMLSLVRAAAGESLAVMRIVSAFAGAASVFFTARLAARLGGMLFAQMLAGLSALMAPIFLAVGRFYSMNVFDLLLWTFAATALVEVIRRGTALRWIVLGLVMGLGLLNKISMLWFGLGLAAGLVISARGRRRISPWTFGAAAIAFLLFAPHLWWQVQHGWPTAEFMRNAAADKMAPVTPLDFALGQLRAMGWANVLVLVPGLLYAWLARSARPWQVLAILFTTVAALLVSAGTSRANYLAVAYPPLFALGGLAWERWTAGKGRWLREPLLGAIVVLGLPWIPFAVPVLPVDLFIRYQTALGIRPSTEERKRIGPLPQHYADMFGWPELAREVGKAAARLTPEERAGAVVFGQNYGEAAAIDVLGPRMGGLPPAVSGHNQYFLWGPHGWDGKVMIIIGGDPEDNARFFESVEQVGVWDDPYAMPYERGLAISIGRGFHGAPAHAWPQLKHYD